ncbi:MAG TPA: hypothetical protein PK755_08180 [Spirochaetota bacterium]|nr:hypothetical protein [Spirochaetota bacterium]
MKKIAVLIFALTVSVLNSFDGLTDKPGSHIEITKDVLRNLFNSDFGEVVKINKNIIYGIEYYEVKDKRYSDVLAYASRDIDLYYFSGVVFYKQTTAYDINKEYSKEKLIKMKNESISNYVAYIQTEMKKVDDLFEKGELYWGYYSLGFVLHSFQDLFAHHGMTNEMHSYFSKNGANPDYDKTSIDNCRANTKYFFNRLDRFLSAKNIDKFRSNLNSPVSENYGEKEVKKFLKRGKDIYLYGPIFLFFTNSSKKAIKYYDEIKWNVEEVVSAIYEQSE